MEFVLKPFIFIYHIVHKVLSFPMKLLGKTEDKIIEVKDKSELMQEAIKNNTLVANNVNYYQDNSSMGNGAYTPSNVAQGGADKVIVNPNNPNEVVSIPTKAGQGVKRARSPLFDFKFVIINAMNKKEKGTMKAESIQDATSFLQQMGYEVLDVEERSGLDVDITLGSHVKAGELSFALTQLSTYIRAGIPLVDSVKILSKQTSNKELKKNFLQIVYELLKGENFSDALDAQGKYFPKLLINMVKTAEMTGDLTSILDDMAEYYTSMDNTRKQMRSAMTYPVVVLTLAFGVLIFMLTFLVPQFASMFESQGSSLPPLTQAILNISDFVKTYWLMLFLGIISFVGGFIALFAKVDKFRSFVQTVVMHIPVFGNIVIYNEIANFTKTFASLLNHGVFITDSMEILSKITNNEIYKRIINKTLLNLGKGDTISSAFRGEWAIPVVAYEMIVTGESTGQLGAMMEKVATHFQNLHKNIIDQMKSLLEPALIIFLAVVVGIILISIVQPMFQMYTIVQ